MLAGCIAVLLENSQSPLERMTIYKSPYFLLVFGPDGRAVPPLVIGQRPYMNAWFGTPPGPLGPLHGVMFVTLSVVLGLGFVTACRRRNRRDRTLMDIY
jgi:hypothetical protein